MSGRMLDLTIAVTALIAVVSLMPVSAAGQTPTAAEKTWNPPRTPDAGVRDKTATKAALAIVKSRNRPLI